MKDHVGRIRVFVQRIVMACALVGVVVLVLPVGAFGADAVPRDPVTDNYKARWNADPSVRERRTWLNIDELVVGPTTYVLATRPPSIQFATVATMRGSDGSTATLELRLPWDNVDGKSFRINPSGRVGPLVKVRDPALLATTPISGTLALTAAGKDIATTAISYRYDATVATAAPSSIEHNGPGGRWWINGRATRLDWESAAPISQPVALPTASLSDVYVLERNSDLRVLVPVTLSAQAPTDVAVSYRFAAGTALAAADFAGSSGSVIIPKGTLTAKIPVVVKGDQLVEASESFSVIVSTVTGATIGRGTALVTIRDDDGGPPPPSAQVSVAAQSRTEGTAGGPPAQMVELCLSVASPTPVTVRYQAVLSATGINPASAADLITANAGTATFPAGATTTTVPLIAPDAHNETNETFTVVLSAPVNATLAASSSASVTIVDDDPVPALSVADATAVEGAPARFVVSISAPSGRAVSASFAVSVADGTASAADVVQATGTVTLPAGTTTVVVEAATLQDTVDEADETFTLLLTQPVSVTMADAAAVATITDDDDTPVISISDATLTEGTGVVGAPEPLTLQLSRPSDRAVTVHWAVATNASGGAGFAGNDDFVSTAGDATFPAGATSTTVDLLAPDALHENTETFTATLSLPSLPVHATLAAAEQPVTIADDDAAPTVSAGDASAIEGSVLTFPVTLSGPSGLPVSVEWTAAQLPGFDATTADFAAGAGTVTFAPRSTSASISVASIQDGAEEPDELLQLALDSPVGATILTATATGTIVDDDSVPALSVADATAVEGAPARFIVSLPTPSERAISATFAVSVADGTASVDDVAEATGTVVLPAGTTSVAVEVATLQDAMDEEDETFALRLTQPISTAIADADAIATIADDDAAPTVSVGSAEAVEGSALTFLATLDSPSSRPVSVEWTAAQQPIPSATALDFAASTGAVTFAPGSTVAFISVASLQDDVDEPDELLQLTLGAPVGATIPGAAAVGTIIDDDPTPTPGSALPERLPMSSGAGGTWYVDGTRGSDAGLGTTASPWRTINKALATVPPAGSVIRVMPGTYTSVGYDYVLLFTRRADTSDPITLLADTPGTVSIRNGDPTRPTLGAWIKSASGLRVQDINITITAQTGISANSVLVENSDRIEFFRCTFNESGSFQVRGGKVDGAVSEDVWLYANTFRPSGTDVFAQATGNNFLSSTYGGSKGSHYVYAGQVGDVSLGFNYRSGSERFVVANNVFAGTAAGRHLELGPQARGSFVVNNTFFGNHAGEVIGWETGARFAGEGLVFYASTDSTVPGATRDNVVMNNLFVELNGHAVYGSGPSESGNLVQGNMSWDVDNARGYNGDATDDYAQLYGASVLFSEGTGNFPRADPRFMNPLGFDFRLAADSPAVGKADPAYTPATDNAGRTRDALPDLGAFERVP